MNGGERGFAKCDRGESLDLSKELVVFYGTLTKAVKR